LGGQVHSESPPPEKLFRRAPGLPIEFVREIHYTAESVYAERGYWVAGLAEETRIEETEEPRVAKLESGNIIITPP
jgi:hypothetical protein